MAKKPIQEIRDELIVIALDLLDEGGLEAVKARTIASRAGISLGSIYNYVGTIEDLLVLANGRMLTELEAAGRAAAETALAADAYSSPILALYEMDEERLLLRQRLLALAERYVEFVQTYNNRWAAMLAFNANMQMATQQQAYQAQQDSLLDLIGAALAQTSIAQTAERRRLTSRALWAGVHGITLLGYLNKTSPEARAETWTQIDILVTTFVNGLSR